MLTKQAITIEEQISTLRKRGMFIASDKFARKVLMDIGYFRLGLYCLAFEEDYPNNKVGVHNYRQGADLKDVVDLYYFDNKLTDILLVSLHHIEVNFRTKMVYILSNKYKNCPAWYVNPEIVAFGFIEDFDFRIYNHLRKSESIIKRHHSQFPNDDYAPAWKTLEFMSFGAVRKLFNALHDKQVKNEIANCYNIKNINVLINYMTLLVLARNICSHVRPIYDITLKTSVIKGPAGRTSIEQRHSLYGLMQVIIYMVSQVSYQKKQELLESLSKLYEEYKSNPIVDRCFSKIYNELLHRTL